MSHRSADAHKGDFGHVLVLAGSVPYSGAALLCVSGALRSGAGLVTLALPKCLAAAVIGKKLPESMLLPLPQTSRGTVSERALSPLREFMEKRATVLCAGPGLDTDPSTRRLIVRLMQGVAAPAVIDASALDAFAGGPERLKVRPRGAARVVTPHPGEMSRLTGISIRRIQNNRKNIAKVFANEYNVTVVLKGNGTIVASPGNPLYINRTGNPGMARGGAGDILSGMIAAFIAQGLGPFEAAKTAVYLHGLAGDLAAKDKTQLGMIASDIAERIPEAIRAASK